MKQETIDRLKEANVIELYQNGMSSNKIAKRTGISKPIILRYLKENNINVDKTKKDYSFSKYTLNEHWLDEINIQEKAYFLGFFYADGNTESLGDKNNYSIRIKLQVQDKYILEKFAEFFESNRPLSYLSESPLPQSKRTRDSYTLRLGNKHLWNRMIELGCPPNKTSVIRFPDFISEELLSHFIRGYFDGDGSIYLRDNGNLANVRICGTEDFL